MFSSIETDLIDEVIEKCYQPLLDLAESGIPLGIEASGVTLEMINKANPGWIDNLKKNIRNGSVELIGSGYSQIIGPLVPSDLNAWNQKIGLDIYNKVLGLRPKIALVNEMSFSSGIIDHYINSGYDAIIMEWDNPRVFNAHWDEQYKYYPQKLQSSEGKALKLLWARSIVFQQFQRYAHSQIEFDEYIKFIDRDISGINQGFFPLYSNDAEIFNFRPGRYKTEANIEHDEWKRIFDLYSYLLERSDIKLVLPSDVMNQSSNKFAFNNIDLTSPEQPIAVKNQKKYNITRWACTGRDDIGINSRCHRLYSRMKQLECESSDDWKELCYLWSSDFRTNLTEKRWNKFQLRLKKAEEKWLLNRDINKNHPVKQVINTEGIKIKTNDREIEIETRTLHVSFNLRKGLSINFLKDLTYSKEPLIGTLKHGYFEDIDWGADYYSGHMLIQPPESPQITDLEPVEAKVKHEDASIQVSSQYKNSKANIEKIWHIYDDQEIIKLEYNFEWLSDISGSMRLGHLTLNPQAFDKNHLMYAVNNGGHLETFPINNRDFDHGKPVSSRVTASHGLGLTEGCIYIGEKNKRIKIELDSDMNAIGLISYSKVDDRYFYRLSFSANEIDDTSKQKEQHIKSFSMKIHLNPSGE